MKIKLLLAGLAFALVSCAGTPEEEEEAAKRFCDCSGDVSEMMTKMKEDPASMDMSAYTKAMEDFKNCVDPDGEMEKREEGMNAEEKKEYTEKMQSLVKASCPDIAKTMGME